MFSNRIKNINLILTLFIVLLHSRIRPEHLVYCPSIYKQCFNIMGNLFDVAVPTFFAISSFLLFRSYSLPQYKDKVISRIRSLIVPYCFFSIVLLVFKNILYYVGHHEIRTSWDSLFEDLYFAKFDAPIWYLRALFYFVLFSPVIYIIIKKGKLGGVLGAIVISLLFNIYFSLPYDTFFFWLPVLLPFSYLGYRFPELLYAKRFVNKFWLGGGSFGSVVTMLHSL